MRRKTTRKTVWIAAVAGMLAVGPMAGPADAQIRKVGFTGVGFSEEIAGVETDRAGLLDVLRATTLLGGDTTRMSWTVFVYGIAKGDQVYAPAVSNPVLFVPGSPSYVELGGGPVSTPWDAFEDPLLGFEEPIFGFEEPIFGFEEPIFGFEPRESFEDPLLGLNAIWGTGNVGIDPDDYALVLFTMPDPAAPGAGGADVQHTAAIVPFSIQER